MTDQKYTSQLGIDFDGLEADFHALLDPKESQFGLLRIDREQHKYKDQVQAMWWGMRNGYPDFKVSVKESDFGNGTPTVALDASGELSPLALDCLHTALACVETAVKEAHHG